MIKDPSVQTTALVGSYVPRRCGIATFTKDLRDAIASENNRRTMVLAMDDTEAGYAYPPEVRFQVQANRLSDYELAADVLNINQVEAVLVQHEFGLYGGRAGDNIITLMRRLRMPILTTLHTVLTEPTQDQRAVMHHLADLSDRLVVMSERGIEILTDVYGIPEEWVAMIPHGIPDVSFVDSVFFKDRFGLEGRRIMLTFGLLSPGKGIEVAIKALPKIVEDHPDVCYIVLGAIHPQIFKREGNAYLNKLERLAERLGIREHVLFHNRFVSFDELCGYLGAADIYVTPYPNAAQIVSGTLAYAMGTGKAVVSTPYWYAEEMLADGRGRLFPFNDSDALASAVNDLLDNPVEHAAMRKRAYMHCRPMIWKEVARNYLQVAQDVVSERLEHPRPVFPVQTPRSRHTSLPDINLEHMRTLTDDTGIFQHAVYSIPDRHHGYCTDDNARALAAAMMYWDLNEEASILPLARTYLSFLHHAFNPEIGRFRNFMTFDRNWLEEMGSEDVHGRSIWGLGLAVSMAPDDAVLALASRLLCDSLEGIESTQSPRSWAFALVGIHAYLKRYSGDSYVRRVRETLACKLLKQFQDNASEEWPWCEDIITYDNAKLPHALILSGRWLHDKEMLEQGLNSLEWLVEQQIEEDSKVTIIGNQGWMTRDGHRAPFDQQPVDAMSVIEACAEAYRCTGDTKWTQHTQAFLDWFQGNNLLEGVLYDSVTGGCRDGLQTNGPNQNEGAESTLAWIISLLTMTRLQREAVTGVSHESPEKPPLEV